MQLSVPNGVYVVGVSGGVDSVVLLDLLQKQSKKDPNVNLIVAHYDHGIRKGSNKDRLLVQKLAKQYGLPFFYAEGHLGSNASEELARDKRYEFLNKIVKENKANGLIVAHHQDDLIESAVINIIRGTGRRGLSSMINPKIIRPLLKYSKSDILKYAQDKNLVWNEDITNKDQKYLRNYIRANLTKKLKAKDKQKLLDIITRQANLNASIDQDLNKLLKSSIASKKLNRAWFSSLDHKTATEVIAFWLKQNGAGSYDKKTIERLSSNLKTSAPNKKLDVFSGASIVVSEEYLALHVLER